MSALRIAVSGLHRGENPQPGASIVSGLRAAYPGARVVGLVYNVYESGIFVEGGPDVAHAMPYPTAGLGAYVSRLAEVQRESPVDWLVPTLDAEIAMLAGAEWRLEELGIRVVLPERGLLERCGKAGLAEFAGGCGMEVPETRVVRDVGEAVLAGAELGYPVYVKGPYYDAVRVGGGEEMAAAAGGIMADWGGPLIVQEPVVGTEFNVMGVGDGEGGLLGWCAVRKFILSSKGKGNGSVVVQDRRLEEMVQRVVAETRWPGPFELEFIRDQRDDRYRLIEINPRFPAWVGFPTVFGANFPALWVDWIRGVGRREMAVVPPGKFFLRHQIEVVGDMGEVAVMLAGGVVGMNG